MKGMHICLCPHSVPAHFRHDARRLCHWLQCFPPDSDAADADADADADATNPPSESHASHSGRALIGVIWSPPPSPFPLTRMLSFPLLPRPRFQAQSEDSPRRDRLVRGRGRRV